MSLFKHRKLFQNYKNMELCLKSSRPVSYVQGQEPEPKVREYFYFIDHQGMVNISETYSILLAKTFLIKNRLQPKN